MSRPIVALFMLAVLASADAPVTFPVTPGTGTDKVLVGKTKLTEVFRLYGPCDDFNMGIIDGLDFSLDINRYYYRKLGVIFITHVFEPNSQDTANAVVDNIIFEKKSGAFTVEGLMIARDSLEQVKAAYGEPDSKPESACSLTLNYEKKGISITVDKMKNRVSEMEVFRAGKHLPSR